MPDAKPPIPSATVLLLRDDPSLEVFMVVRHHQIDFASGALVFPGGKADQEDFDDAFRERCASVVDDPVTRGLQVAALREAYEECGVLLARPDGGEHLLNAERLATMEPQRDALNAHTTQFLDILEAEGLTLANDLLVPFAHWVTPEMMPKRFDTHFFLARAPEDQLALHDGHESVDSVWIEPAEALAEAEAGTKTIIFPTLRNLEKLADFASTEEALTRTRTTPVITVLPWSEKRDDGAYICIPRDAGYAVTEERIPDRPAS